LQRRNGRSNKPVYNGNKNRGKEKKENGKADQAEEFSGDRLCSNHQFEDIFRWCKPIKKNPALKWHCLNICPFRHRQPKTGLRRSPENRSGAVAETEYIALLCPKKDAVIFPPPDHGNL
jgi:hypothetical protein